MKIHIKIFVFTVLLFAIGSCKDDIEVQCLDILLPMTVNIKYVDEDGKNLLFGESAEYSVADLNIYITENDEQVAMNFTGNEESRFITIDVPQVKDGAFFIELKPDEIDKITYHTEINEDDYCKNHIITKLKQNNNEIEHDKQNDVWMFVK